MPAGAGPVTRPTPIAMAGLPLTLQRLRALR